MQITAPDQITQVSNGCNASARVQKLTELRVIPYSSSRENTTPNGPLENRWPRRMA